MITVMEHFIIFVVLSLLVSLVYSGLRQDDLKKIIILGLKRFVVFMGAGAALGVLAFFIARAL